MYNLLLLLLALYESLSQAENEKILGMIVDADDIAMALTVAMLLLLVRLLLALSAPQLQAQIHSSIRLDVGLGLCQ